MAPAGILGYSNFGVEGATTLGWGISWRGKAMAAARLIATRLTVCPVCGHEARLVASTSDGTISRCYACGDVTDTPRAVGTAWSAAASLRGTRQIPVPGDESPVPPGDSLAAG